MVRKKFPDGLPYSPLLILKKSGPIDWDDIKNILGDRDLSEGVSLCIISEDGTENRGGYFFHIIQENGKYFFSTIEREHVCEFNSEEHTLEFINHVSGRKYSEPMWRLSQKINLRTDDYS